MKRVGAGLCFHHDVGAAGKRIFGAEVVFDDAEFSDGVDGGGDVDSSLTAGVHVEGAVLQEVGELRAHPVHGNRVALRKPTSAHFLSPVGVVHTGNEHGQHLKIAPVELQVLDLLAGETSEPIKMADFECALLAEDVALVTYRASRTDAGTGIQFSSLRSSIWTKKPGGWCLRFHQGTRIP